MFLLNSSVNQIKSLVKEIEIVDLIVFVDDLTYPCHLKGLDTPKPLLRGTYSKRNEFAPMGKQILSF